MTRKDEIEHRGRELLIVGAGGFGREVKWLTERINSANKMRGKGGLWHVAGFIDDGIEAGTLIEGIPVLGGMLCLEETTREVSVVCAIGNACIRKAIVERIAEKKQIHFPNLIDPSIVMSERVALGKGNILCAGSILTVNIQIQDFVILNLDCTVGHDVELGSYVTVYPGVNLSGCVKIGDCSEVGTGCHVIQGIRIGPETIAGAGSVVIRDLPGKCTAVGNPAKVIKKSVKDK